MRVLSLGAGVQSSTLLLMACEGLEPIDAADRRPRMTTVLHLGRLKVIFGGRV